jgi:hypothetical protein
MSRMSLTRRACLVGLLGAPALMLGREASQRSPNADSALHARLVSGLSMLVPRESAIAVGLAYLREHEDVALQTELAEALQASRVVPAPQQLRRHLSDAVRADFRNGRMVLVKNWYLALTEARACAMIALYA